MIDDLCGIAKCNWESVITNSVINSFVESKQLEFGDEKCHKLHVGKKCGTCLSLQVHGKMMKETSHEKYLGDIFSEHGSNNKNFEARQARGFGVASEIISILKEVPLGRYRIESGVKLRQALFINSVLTNSEVW